VNTFFSGLVFLFGFLGWHGLYAQPLAFTSPRQTGLAGLVAPRGDGYAAILSPAAMGDMDVVQAAVTGGSLYGINGLPLGTVGVAGPVYGLHKAGLGITRLGRGALTQTFVAGSYAYILDRTSLALQAGYYQLALGDAPTAAVPTFSMSGQTRLIPKLTLAGQVNNLTQPKLRKDSDERLAASLRATAMYEPSADVSLLLQVDKTLNRAAGLGAGVEYRVHRYVQIRCGAAPWPGFIAAGVRLDVWGAVLEYGVAHNGLLGQVHSLGLGWSFLPKSKIEANAEPAD